MEALVELAKVKSGQKVFIQAGSGGVERIGCGGWSSSAYSDIEDGASVGALPHSRLG